MGALQDLDIQYREAENHCCTLTYIFHSGFKKKCFLFFYLNNLDLSSQFVDGKFLVVQWTRESAKLCMLHWEVVCTSSFSQRKTGEKERDRQHG